MDNDVIEIRWHGRGGQGAITAAKITAKTAFQAGYGGVVMAPTFGTERRGAPVHTSLKISKTKIWDLSPIEEPDIVIVLDHLILEEVDVTAGIKPNGLLILNTPKEHSHYNFNDIRLATANVSDLAASTGLKKGVVNTGIIGVFSKATQLLKIDDLATTIEEEFLNRKAKENAEAARRCYEHTITQS